MSQRGHTEGKLFPGTFYNIPTYAVYTHRACSHTHSHTIFGYPVLRGPTLMRSKEREPALGREGPVGHLGWCSSLISASCSTSWEPVQEGEATRAPESALSEPQLFMWFQLARAIQDFKGIVAKDGPACLSLSPPEPAPVRSSARKQKAHARMHNLKGAATTQLLH